MITFVAIGVRIWSFLTVIFKVCKPVPQSCDVKKKKKAKILLK